MPCPLVLLPATGGRDKQLVECPKDPLTGLSDLLTGLLHRSGVGVLDLKEMQQEVDRWIAPFGYWHPLANLARLTEEVGELSREVNHRWGPKTKKPTEETADLALEMGDILFVVAAMANQMNVDLEDAFRKVIAKYEERDKDRWQRKD